MPQTKSQKEWYERNRERVIEKVMKRQNENHDEYLAYQEQHREENIEQYRDRSRNWKSNNREKHREYSRKYSREHKDEISEKRKSERRALKFKIVSAYGGKCECCGETIIEFLTIDHINGDGADHRRNLGTKQSRALYEDIIGRNFPPDFRILCFNCNTSLGFYGYCPHRPDEKHQPNRGEKARLP